MEMHYGFKRITEENWLQADPASSMFAGIDSDGQIKPFVGKDWVQNFATPHLTENVPEDICKLFEVARGCLIYGHFFYPMYTLGQEQLFRIAETAVMQKCAMMGAPDGVRGFRNGVEWLIKMNIIDHAEANTWSALVELRNLASHPQEQVILPPGLALSTLTDVANDINSLFE